MRAARFDDLPAGRGFALGAPRGTVIAQAAEEVRDALARVEAAVAGGLWAAGWVAYEAAPGLDPGLAVRPRPTAGEPFAGLPLVAFGLFAQRRAVLAAGEGGSAPPDGADAADRGLRDLAAGWRPTVSPAAYAEAIAEIHRRIADGDTYQVNHTFRLRAPFAGDAAAVYRALAAAQGGAYCGSLDLGRFAVLCASPELFFEIDGDRLTTRPMKGTAARGRWSEEDRAAARRLAASPKERAENVMIVDLLRNDLGRLAVPGSVAVERLLAAERYPTVWQLTSTLSCRLAGRPGLAEIFAALFPCGSITGAPKRSTMAIVAGLEATPRGVYTGAVGWLAPPGTPGPRARFAVAIRTLTVDREAGLAEYGVGGGVTAGSSAAGEYEEARLKARVLSHRRPRFDLVETLRWEPEAGFPLLQRHLERLAASAGYFGFRFDRRAVVAALQAAVLEAAPGRQEAEPRRDAAGEGGLRSPEAGDGSTAPGGQGRVGVGPARAAAAPVAGVAGLRVRLALSPSGVPSVTVARLPPAPAGPLRLAVDPEPVDPADPLLFHKTTLRERYDRRRARWPDHDDVLLVNDRGEVTESTIANLAVRLDGRWWTPPLASGCLPGVYRAELLARGEIAERSVPLADLDRAEEIALLNAVRLWRPAEVAPAARPAAAGAAVSAAPPGAEP